MHAGAQRIQVRYAPLRGARHRRFVGEEAFVEGRRRRLSSSSPAMPGDLTRCAPISVSRVSREVFYAASRAAAFKRLGYAARIRSRAVGTGQAESRTTAILSAAFQYDSIYRCHFHSTLRHEAAVASPRPGTLPAATPRCLPHSSAEAVD